MFVLPPRTITMCSLLHGRMLNLFRKLFTFVRCSIFLCTSTWSCYDRFDALLIFALIREQKQSGWDVTPVLQGVKLGLMEGNLTCMISKIQQGIIWNSPIKFVELLFTGIVMHLCFICNIELVFILLVSKIMYYQIYSRASVSLKIKNEVPVCKCISLDSGISFFSF